LDSDEKRTVIVFVSIFAGALVLKTIAILVIGNESDCGYVGEQSTYEILTLACPIYRFLSCIMR
jgi:hypothetical protein